MARTPGSPINLGIVIPTMEHVHALFAYDLAQLMGYTASVMPDHCSIGLHMNVGTYIHKSRTELLQDALAAGATHILWLDSDMRFPQDAAIRLLQRQVPFVGINYSTRRMPPEFVGIKKVPRGDDDPADGIRLQTLDESEGLEEVDALGFGCFLMEAATLVNLPDPAYDPWFWFEKTRYGMEVGEDVFFCLRMIQDTLNDRIFVDHDLSKECGHLGTLEYKIYHPWVTIETREERDALAAVEGEDA